MLVATYNKVFSIVVLMKSSTAGIEFFGNKFNDDVKWFKWSRDRLLIMNVLSLLPARSYTWRSFRISLIYEWKMLAKVLQPFSWLVHLSYMLDCSQNCFCVKIQGFMSNHIISTILFLLLKFEKRKERNNCNWLSIFCTIHHFTILQKEGKKL